MNITVPFTNLKKIVHLADIHIRLFKRHDEYVSCFSTLYKQLLAEDLSEGIIVLAGDILHAKLDMSPEMVVIATDFLKSLADIAPTILIAGNHDLNLSNLNRMDTLTPLVKSINHSNLFYLKNSGIYTVADTDFATFSLLDNQEEWPHVSDCTSRNKIALYHGPVTGAVTDAKFVISNSIDANTFRGFDMVLLGDIHTYQVLQEYDPTQNKPIIVYPSSLIQQNHGETLHNHGWCLWDVPTRTHQFREIPNEFGYYTLEVKNGNLPIPTDMPKNVRLRLFTGAMESSEVKKVIAVLRSQFNVIELSVNKSRLDKKILTDKVKTTIDSVDLNSVSVQNEYIKDWLQRTYDAIVDDTLMQKILDINTKLNTVIVSDDQSRNIHWRPLTLKFSNMLSYGEDNFINFDDMRGVYGIFAPNASGKSASIDALIFALYDKTPRAFKGDHIINNRKDTFECELKFEIDNEVFGIRRTGNRKKTGEVKVDVLFWKDNIDGTPLSLNGKDRRDTNANIRNYVGTYEDFVLTALSSQNSNSLFIDKSHSERKDLLIQFMGLSIFDKLCDAANNEIKEVTGALRKFKKTDFSQQLVDFQIKIDYTKLEHIAVMSEYEQTKLDREQLDSELRSLHSKKLPTPNIDMDLSTMQAKLNSLCIKREELLSYKDDILSQINLLSSKIRMGEEELATYDLESLRKTANDMIDVQKKLSIKRNSMKVLETQIREKREFESKLLEYKFNLECDICVENNKSIIEDLSLVRVDIDTIDKKMQSCFTEIEVLENQVTSLQEVVTTYEYTKTLQTNIERLNSTLHKKNTELKDNELNSHKIDTFIEKLQNDITLYEMNQDSIEHNSKINSYIASIDSKIMENKNKFEATEKTVRNLHGSLISLEGTKQQILQNIKEAEELERTHEAYKYYMEAVGRNGIPYEMMGKTIPSIENEINNILTQIVDFTITLEVDGKNIEGRLNYDHNRIWPLENSSGMERFISSLAIRVALMNACNLPKPNFMLIDEGLGTLHKDNLAAMYPLFNILKTQFDFMIVISHLDEVRDMVDNVIEIKREDGFSYIQVL